jgi:hypothetical protein
MIKIPSRKPITKIKTEKEMTKILEPYFGNRDKGQYFIGAAFGPGWNDIVLDLHNKLVKENPDYFIAQIKEKFSSLRYYTGPLTEAGWEYVREAEELSSVTCEECGRPGKIRGGTWILTLCNWDNRVAKINQKIWNIYGWFRMKKWKRK